jgi:hypothetical protein
VVSPVVIALRRGELLLDWDDDVLLAAAERRRALMTKTRPRSAAAIATIIRAVVPEIIGFSFG